MASTHAGSAHHSDKTFVHLSTMAENNPLPTPPSARSRQEQLSKDVDTMDSFTPATDIWIPGYDQFDRPCWQNKRTQKIHYDLTGQLPRSFGASTNMNLPYGPYFRPGIGTFPEQGMYENTDARSTSASSSSRDTPPLSPRLQSMPTFPPGLGDIPSFPPGQGNKSSNKAPPLEKQSETKSPAPPTSRAEEAKQWTRKRDVRGYYYLNSVTGETQSKTPDCLKKYTGCF